jgi:hypothetical protein
MQSFGRQNVPRESEVVPGNGCGLVNNDLNVRCHDL